MRPPTVIEEVSRVLTEKKHLDLIPLHHFISLQLVLDLLVPGLALLLFCAHTTTHLAGLLCVRAQAGIDLGVEELMVKSMIARQPPKMAVLYRSELARFSFTFNPTTSQMVTKLFAAVMPTMPR
jgi:hypothetical protein